MTDRNRSEARDVTAEPDRLYTNDARTVLVTIWPSGTMTVAIRATPSDVWGAPVYLKETK